MNEALKHIRLKIPLRKIESSKLIKTGILSEDTRLTDSFIKSEKI